MAESMPRVGAMFGHYRLDRLLGRGGMGEVYEAYDTVKDRTVALKVLTERLASDPVYRQRFQREAHAAARLKEAHVIPIHDYGEINGHLYLDMRLVEGRSLRELLTATGPLPPQRAVAIVTQIGAALDAAHRDQLVHRDVKPDNILVTPDDFAYLVDFGIANTVADERLTAIGGAVGSFPYMAPERFDSGPITPSADIYALACVLYECLTGARPFRGGTDAELVRAHLFDRPPSVSQNRPGTPQALDPVIARGLAKDPNQRYPAAGALTAAARDALTTRNADTVAAPTIRTPLPPGGFAPTGQAAAYAPTGQAPLPVQGAQPRSTPPPPPPAQRSRGKLLIVAAAVMVVALAVGFGIWKFAGGSDDSTAEAATPAVDVGTLDVGRYSTQPVPLSGNPSEAEGRSLEAFRLAEALADPYDVDASMSHRYGLASPDPAFVATSISGTATPIAQPVLEQFGMISAYQVQGYSKRLTDWLRSPEGEALILVVMSFPNPDAATRAAEGIDAADFAVNSDNIATTIPGYPDAKAHYRPGNPSIAVTLAHKGLVASILTASTTIADIETLEQRVRTALDLQVPLMDEVLPATAASLTSLPRDPDRMLSRAFGTEEQRTISPTFGSIGPRAATLCEGSQSHRDGLFEAAGVDRCAFTTESRVLRASDDAAAATLLTDVVRAETDEFVDHMVDPPGGVTDAQCYEQKQEIWEDDANTRFVCSVAYGRYVASVWSNDEKDARQRGAAQYAILVNS